MLHRCEWFHWVDWSEWIFDAKYTIWSRLFVQKKKTPKNSATCIPDIAYMNSGTEVWEYRCMPLLLRIQRKIVNDERALVELKFANFWSAPLFLRRRSEIPVSFWLYSTIMSSLSWDLIWDSHLISIPKKSQKSHRKSTGTGDLRVDSSLGPFPLDS